MAQRRQTDAGLIPGRRAALARLAPAAGALAAAPGLSAGFPGGLAGGLLAAAAGLAGCATRQPAVPSASVNGGPFVLPMAAPAPRLGERWTYREINEYNKGTVGQLEQLVTALAPLTLEQRRTEASPSPLATPRGARTITFDSAWSALIDASFDDEYHYSPAVPLLPPRLEPGSSVSTRHRFSVPGNSGLYGWRQRVTASRAEIVETPAGRFDTLVIERQIYFDSPDPFRFDRARQETRWYAPAINGFVRRTWTGTYIDEGSLDQIDRRREDWVTLELVRHVPGKDQGGA